MNVDPDIPVILMVTLGLVLFAVVGCYAAIKWLLPLEQQAIADAKRKAEKKIADREAHEGAEGTQQEDYWALFMIIAGIVLFCFTMVGVLSLAKAFGPTAKGLGILIVVGFAAAGLGVAAMLRHGNRFARSLTLGLMAIVVCSALAAGLFAVGGNNTLLRDIEFAASRVYDEAIDDFGQAWERMEPNRNHGEFAEEMREASTELSELGAELSAEMSGVVDELGLSRPKIPLDSVTGGTPEPPTPPNPSALPDVPTPPEEKETDDQPKPEVTPDAVKVPAPVVSVAASQEIVSVESEPFESVDAAREDAYRKLRDLIRQEVAESRRVPWGETGWIDAIADEELAAKLGVQEEVTTKELSVGEMQLVKLTAPSPSLAQSEWLSERYAEWSRGQQRERGMRLVTAGGLGVLGLLGVAYGALSLGQS